MATLKNTIYVVSIKTKPQWDGLKSINCEFETQEKFEADQVYKEFKWLVSLYSLFYFVERTQKTRRNINA